VLPQQASLHITGQPTNPLFEANQVTPGINASLTVLTLTGNSPKFDIAALLAAGWQDIGNGNFIKPGTFGTAALSTTSGTVTYVLDNDRDVTQALRPGDVEHDEFVIPVTDSSGSSSFTVNFTVNGSNDAPVVVTTANLPPHIQTVSQAAAVVDAGVTVSDVDSDTLTGATVKITDGAQSGDALTINGATSGTVAVSGGHTIQFSYDSSTHVLSLSGAASLADYQAVLRTVGFSNTGDNVANSARTIAFQVDDGSGDDNLSDIATATIALNHLPAGTADAGSVTEDAATTVVTGNVLANDVDIDSADTHTVTAVAGATDNGSTFTIVGTYGTLVVDKATGAYTYTLANGQANVQALADGQTVTDVFNYTNTDNHGASGSAALTISVHGTNDAPTVDLTPIITEVPIPDLSQHPGTDPAAQDLVGPAISQDGRWVVFFSNDGLPTGGDNSSPQGDVFLYDRLSGVTRVLTDDEHIQNRPAGEHYSGFSVSADGNTAVFRGSHFVDQLSGPPIELNQIYVYDRTTDTTRALTNPDNGHDYQVNDEPRLSASNLIVFAETDFGNNTQPPTQHLRVTDLAGHIRSDITLATVGLSDPNPGDPNHNLQFVQPDISGNGRFLTFWAIEQQFNPGGNITSLGDATLYTFDRTTGQHQVIATSGASDDPWWASMSNDGRFVVFQSDSDALDVQIGGVANHTVDIFLFDRQAATVADRIVGITDRGDFQATYGSGAFGSGRASISPDGRFVVFASDATNLVAGDTNGLGDTFVYNIQGRTFSRVSLGPDGTVQGDDASVFGADISFAGFIAAFGSTANNFVVPVETDGKSNVFVVDRSGGTAGAVIEDVTTPGTASGSADPNTLSTHGAFAFNDIDLTDAHTVSVTGVSIDATGAPGFVVPAGGLGTLTPSVIDSTNSGHGQIAWDFVVDNAAVQGLNDFQIIRQTFTVQISDGHGGTVTQTVTIRIAGENDAAVVSGATAGTVTEAGGFNNNNPGTPTASGTLTDTDADNQANSFQAVTAPRGTDHGFGTFMLTQAGLWTYTLDNSNASVQALTASAHLTDTFTVRTADGTAQLVTITINGANDAPVLTNVGPSGTTTEGIPNLLDTNVSVSDVELNSLNGGQGNYAGASLQIARSSDPGTHQHDIFGFDSVGASFTVVGNTLVSGGQVFATFTHPTGPGSGTGILTINFTSQQTVATTALVNNVIDHITYTNNNDDPPGNPTLVYTFNDGNGGTATGNIVVSLTRVNDAPNITPDAPTEVSYTENAQPTQLLATGAVSDPDIDVTHVDATRPDHFSGGSFHIQITGGFDAGDQIVLLGNSGFSESNGALLFGSDTVGAISGLGTANVLVSGFTNIVTPAVASDLARAFGFQSSSENPSSDDRTVAFTFNDGGANGGGPLTDTVTQVVHITPVNDPADISGNLTGDVTDTGGGPIVLAAAFSGGDGGEGGPDPSIATGTLSASDVDDPADTFVQVPSPTLSDNHYGHFTMVGQVWTYTLDTGNADVRALPEGGELTDTFTVHSIDGTPQQISITINGANDEASIGGSTDGSVEEDGTLTTGGALAVSDVDTGEDHFQNPDSLVGVYGTFNFDPTSGVWGYTLANGQSNVQALAANTTVYDTLVVTSFDGTATQTIDVAINGANDAPELTLDEGSSITDQFFTRNYGAWSEANDGGGASGGEIQLAHDALGNPAAFQILLSDLDSEVGVPDTIQRSIDLSGATSATVTFDYRRDIADGETNDRFLVLASSDGVNFTEIGQIGAEGDGSFVDPAYQTFTFDLSAFISANTTIRFSVGDDVDNGDVVYVDNINFTYVPGHFNENGPPVAFGLSSHITDVDNTDMRSALIVLTNAQDGDFLLVGGNPKTAINSPSVASPIASPMMAAARLRSSFRGKPAARTISPPSIPSGLPMVRTIRPRSPGCLMSRSTTAPTIPTRQPCRSA
jgi:VCBS repeat-containing protein